MPFLFRQLVARAGRPPADPYKDLELYSFWVGNILPTSTRDRQEMLQARSTKQRMAILLRLMMETIEQTRLSAEDAGLALNVGGGGFSRAVTTTTATGAEGTGARAGARDGRNESVELDESSDDNEMILPTPKPQTDLPTFAASALPHGAVPAVTPASQRKRSARGHSSAQHVGIFASTGRSSPSKKMKAASAKAAAETDKWTEKPKKVKAEIRPINNQNECKNLLRDLPGCLQDHLCNGQQVHELLPHGTLFSELAYELVIELDQSYAPTDQLLALHKHGDGPWQILNEMVELSDDGKHATVRVWRFSYLALLNGAAAAAAIGGAVAAGATLVPAAVVGSSSSSSAAAAAAGGVALGMVIGQLSTVGLRREPVACPMGSSGFQIFLSYRRIDADKARSIQQALVALGYRVFMDITSEGLGAGDFQAQLERHLRCTPVVVALCTATVNPARTEACEFLRIKNAGDFVRLEIRAALHMNKLLIPLWTSAAPGTPAF
eukprot:COSAG02_NODE_6743_length_3389_cov_1.334347_6_plen_494_part_01